MQFSVFQRATVDYLENSTAQQYLCPNIHRHEDFTVNVWIH